jgi:hypothetical protein
MFSQVCKSDVPVIGPPTPLSTRAASAQPVASVGSVSEMGAEAHTLLMLSAVVGLRFLLALPLSWFLRVVVVVVVVQWWW